VRIPVPARRVASRVLRGQAIILHPDSDELQRLNEVGSFLWGLITARTHTIEALVVALAGAFEVEPAVAERDLMDFLGELEGKGLLDFLTAPVGTEPTAPLHTSSKPIERP